MPSPPKISEVLPASAAKGSVFTIIVIGEGFEPSSKLLLDDKESDFDFKTSGELWAEIDSSISGEAGVKKVKITSVQSGSESNAVDLIIE